MEEKEFKGIDLLALIRDVLKEWKTLTFWCSISGIIGIIVALCTPREYTSEVKMIPETTSGIMGGGLSDLAASFGINLFSNNSQDAIYPEIYPEILSSTDFLLSLFDVKVRLKDSDSLRSYIYHIRKEYKLPFWSYPMEWLKEKIKKADQGINNKEEDPFWISKNDLMSCEDLNEIIGCSIDKKTSEITIIVTDQDPMVAAIMTDTLQSRLQSYITEYRTKKARNDYEYYDKLSNDAEEEYNYKKEVYTRFEDSHRGSVLSSISTQRQQLLNEMTTAYQTYSLFVQMRDAAKARIQERTPAFTIIQSAKMSYKPSSRSRKLTVLIYITLGGILGSGWIIYRKKLLKKAL